MSAWFSDIEKSPLYEALKEAVRLAIFAFVSVLVSSLIEKLTILPDQNTVIFILTLGLRFADKLLHEARKDKRTGIPSNSYGLLPF